MRTYGKDQIIVALDVPNATKALTLVHALRGVVGGFKIGSRLFTAEGPSIVREVVGLGARVFLDLKYHDIPNTVAEAVEVACGLGVWMVNLHCSGGRKMMLAAMEAANKYFTEHDRRPLIIGVTVLTSHDLKSLGEIDIRVATMEAAVINLVQLAHECGLDGVVCSPKEVVSVRQTVCGDEFLIVTPGIRAIDAPPDDQMRTTTAVEAIRSGSSFIVVGRPIIGATDPIGAAQHMTEQINDALGAGQEA